ncbi:MAG: dTMP kinase [Candidatus Cloacimonas sp. 4484_209]|nr:MAG: dTMP kinase [Candidatus Cloacimonas sp. 4484_209]
MKKGLFITFEGCEGSGKTTQAKRLYRYLKKRQYKCILTHEPGGTVISEKIRRILLNKTNSEIAPLTELFLYLASRAQHTEEVIKPFVKKGAIVISDRYADSSLSYQGAARKLSIELVKKLNKIATSDIAPDITFVIDIDPKKGLKRISGKDRIEREKIKFHLNVRETYLKIAKLEKKRIKLIDGDKPKDEIFSEVLNKTLSHPWFKKQ